MFRNYVKIAWRNITKYRFYSVVNIIGLSTGIVFTLLIGAFVWSAFQVNKHLKNADQQYIIQSHWKNANEGSALTTLGPLAKSLREYYPGLVANYFRWDGITSIVSRKDKKFRESIAISDSTMLNMYGFKLIHGNAATVLNAPFSVVITADKARKYFGTADVIGQSLTIENFSGEKHEFTITGIMEAPKKNSVTWINDANNNQIFISIRDLDFFGRNMQWANPHILSYVQLQKGVSPKDLVKPIAQLIEQHAPPGMAADLTPVLVPLNEYYLSANNGLMKKMLYGLSALSILILIMAVVNFTNLSISRSSVRMREIGIRKALGGLKSQLIRQFLTESILIVGISTLLAFILYSCTYHLFSNILGADIPSLLDFPLWFMVFPFLLVFAIGLMAGIYPAFVLSSMKSVDSLKGKLTGAKENLWLRKFLVAFQFITATIAFTGAIIISKQMDLFLHGDLGYNKDFILSAQLPREWTREGVNKMETIRDEFAKIGSVQKVSLSYEIPDGNNSNNVSLYKFGTDSTQAIAASILENDDKFLAVYHIPLIAGSSFKGHRQDSLKVILNATAVKALGWKDAQQAIGHQVKIPGNHEIYTIAGVTDDFHFGSLQTKVAPIIMFNLEYDLIYRYLSFKIKPGNISATINALQKKWSMLMPDVPFDYRFMDETLAGLYKSEMQLKKASYVATILAIIIVLLGVTGLISLSIQKRMKEIGIRKVLGSSVAAIVGLFIKEFLLIVLVAGIIACPLAYLIMNNWLHNYAYRIDIKAIPFILSIGCLGIVTALLICLQAIKAARVNPIESLRTE